MLIARVLALGALLVPLLSGCAIGHADEGTPRVVASFYPLQYVAQRIAGQHATVSNLTHPGMEPHDIELTVGQTADIVDADVVLYEKGFQAAVDQAVDQNGPEHVVDAARFAGLDPDNPHFWLDPRRLAKVATAFEAEMAAADPAHASAYAARLRRLRRDLDDLDRDLAAGLAHCAIRTTVVGHDAFGYLSRYGPRFVAINGLSPDAEPSPSHIKALHDLILTDGITTVFSETLASPAMADTLAGDLGIKAAVLDPIEGLSDRTRNEDYLSLMRQDLAALEKANRCSA